MTNFRLALVGVDNGDYIETTRVIIESVAANEAFRGSFDMSLLGEGYGRLYGKEFLGGSGFHFDEDDGFLVLHDEIDFAAGRGIIACDQPKAKTAQKLAREFFASSSKFRGVLGWVS